MLAVELQVALLRLGPQGFEDELSRVEFAGLGAELLAARGPGFPQSVSPGGRLGEVETVLKRGPLWRQGGQGGKTGRAALPP